MNFAIYQNFGLIAILIIFYLKWIRGEEIKSAESFTTLSLIFFLFYSVTGFFLYSINTMTQFMVLLTRLADVFSMDEFVKKRVEDCPKEECGVELRDASFKWGFRVSNNQET